MSADNKTISKVLVTINKYKDLKSLKVAVAEGKYSSIESPHTFSRTLAWKSSLITNSLNIKQWAPALSGTRAVFHEITKREDMGIPWYCLDKDSEFFKPRSHHRQISVHRIQTKSRESSERERVSQFADQINMGNVNDRMDLVIPSRCESELYTVKNSDIELLKSIILDIDRLFPGEAYFKANNSLLSQSKTRIIEVLYVWCKCNPLVGYKQGVHEIIGLFCMELEREALSITASGCSGSDLQILGLYDVQYISHDLFTIFNRFIVSSGIVGLLYELEEALWSSIDKFNVYLMKVDQLIHYSLLNRLKLESQLWIIRYLRLILLREMDSDLELVALLWDKLIILDHGEYGLLAVPDVLMFMTIQLLIQIKSDLIASDFSGCLSLLLHYPFQARLIAHSSKLLMINHMYRDAIRLYAGRNDDRQLYERGIKLNARYNPTLKIKMNVTNKSAADSTELGLPLPV